MPEAALFAKNATSLIPRVSNPFFIVTPPYARVSAGVTVLHLLCHYLNLAGETAYILHYPPQEGPIRSLPNYATLQMQPEIPAGMLAPLITQDVLEFYDKAQITPIVIYPEVFDNPLNAKFFGRFILNYPGKLNSRYQQREKFALAYTKVLADHCTNEYPDHPAITDVLFVPTSDFEFWNLRGAREVRSGTCYYAGKLREIHKTEPKNVPEGSVEILRSQHMSRSEVRDLFWKSELFYCYEDTALALEAILCGCPTVFVPNEFFTGDPLAINETGKDGLCRLDEPSGIDRARKTIGNSEAILKSYIRQVPGQIASLAQKWRSLAAAVEYQGTISYPFEPRMVFFSRALAPQMDDQDHDDFSLDDGARPGFLMKSILLAYESYRAGGVRKVISRIAFGFRRYGIRGFFALLRG